MITRRDWLTPLVFLLSMALTGLSFYPALIIVVAMMFKAYRNSPYDFVIMCLLFLGNYGLTQENTLPVKTYDICVITCLVLFFIYLKPPIVKRTITVVAVYGIALLCIAWFSLESMSVQLYTWRNYLAFIFFIIPIVVFSRRQFVMTELWNSLFPYVFIICIFYIIDAFIFSGNILVPCTAASRQSTFFDPLMSPLSFAPFRKYPPGLFPMVLLLYPVARYYKLHFWQWCVIILALFASQTFSVLSGFVAAYIFFRFGLRKLLLAISVGLVSLVSLYFIDGFLPEKKNGDIIQSQLRIKSSVDQFFDLMDASDDEDIAEFASGRMAQILPKVELVNEEGRQWTGLGFLHPEKNTVKKYVIDNEYYSDIEFSEEVAALVEVIPVQIYISTGWFGLIVHIIFLVVIYMMIRKLKYAPYLLSVYFCCIWFGLGGFCGLISAHGLFLVALSYSAIILNSRSQLSGFPPLSDK